MEGGGIHTLFTTVRTEKKGVRRRELQLFYSPKKPEGRRRREDTSFFFTEKGWKRKGGKPESKEKKTKKLSNGGVLGKKKEKGHYPPQCRMEVDIVCIGKGGRKGMSSFFKSPQYKRERRGRQNLLARPAEGRPQKKGESLVFVHRRKEKGGRTEGERPLLAFRREEGK